MEGATSTATLPLSKLQSVTAAFATFYEDMHYFCMTILLCLIATGTSWPDRFARNIPEMKGGRFEDDQRRFRVGPEEQVWQGSCSSSSECTLLRQKR